MKPPPHKASIETLLFHIQQLINNPSHAGENKIHTDTLVEIFESITGVSAHFDMNDWQDANLSSGVAISPVQAARCLQETVRTQAFLKGVNAAIEEKLNTHHALHILYAGTGPYGPLLLPLLGIYKDADIKATLIDIHPENIDALKKIITALDIADHIQHIEVADATQWRPPGKQSYDLIISETMNNLLRREPQVSIFKHLQQFLTVDGDLIPQQINIGAELVHPKTYHANDNPLDIATNNENFITQHLGDFFQCNRQTMSALHKSSNSCLSGKIPLPETLKSNKRYSLMFTTTINIYGEHQLRKTDSSLNIPICYYDLKLKGGDVIHFEYRLTDDPRFVFDIPIIEETEITTGNIDKLPAIDDTGRLNIVHLKRLWYKSQLNRGNHLEKSIMQSEWPLDAYLLELLGTPINETMAFLYQRQPDFCEFEAWLSPILPSEIVNNSESVNKAFLAYTSKPPFSETFSDAQQ